MINNLVQEENEKPGTKDWMISDEEIILSHDNYGCKAIEGYCSKTSVTNGEDLEIFVSTNPSATFSLKIYRMGYYKEQGGRLMMAISSIDGIVQNSFTRHDDGRIIGCNWKSSVTLNIPDCWLSGVYLGKLTVEGKKISNHIIFIVRDSRPARLIFQCSDMTWQAYNRWPQNSSLYDCPGDPWWWGPDSIASSNRPYGKAPLFELVAGLPKHATGSGEWFQQEYQMAYWLEKEGYDVTYVSNFDTHYGRANIVRAKGFLSVGHDEYYTNNMFDELLAARDSGVSLLFFSGNSIFGRVDICDADRTFRRVGVFSEPGTVTTDLNGIGKLPHVAPFSKDLIGGETAGTIIGVGDWICEEEGHWIYAGTGMKNADKILHLIGWECHDKPQTDIPNLKILAKGFVYYPGITSHQPYAATVYEMDGGSFVFNASTCWWGAGLSRPPVHPVISYGGVSGPDVDPRVEQITRNILNRALSR